ncbi:unnamed protein product [Closterium sp. NIES-53]
MEVARTLMIHATAPHFLWPFAVRYAAHQLNLWPRVSLPETLPTMCWTGKVGNASVFRVWGSRAFVRDTSADKLSTRAIPSVFLGFPPDAPGWQFYHPTSSPCRDESVPFYCLFPYCSAPPPPPPLFLAPSPPPVDPLPPQGPAPCGVSQVDPLPGTMPVEVAGDSGDAGCAASEGAASGGAEPGGTEPRGAESEGAGARGVGLGGAEPAGVELGGAEPEGVEPRGAESEGAEFGGVEPRGTASSRGPAGASPRLSPWPEPLSPQQLREWFAQRTRLRSRSAGAGDSAARDTGARGVGATRLGGAGVAEGAGGTGGAAAAGPGGAHTTDTGAAETGSVGGAGARGSRAGDPAESVRAGAGGIGASGAGAGGAGAGYTGAVGATVGGTRASGAGARVARAFDPGAGGAGAGGIGAGGAGGGGAGAVDLGAGGAGGVGAVSGNPGAGGTMRPRPYFVPLLEQVHGLPFSRVLTPPLLCPPPDQSQSPLQPTSPLPAPSPYTEQTRDLTERREPESRRASPVPAIRTGRRVPRPRPPPVPSTHHMALHPSFVPLRVPLPSPPASSLADDPDPKPDLVRAASPPVPGTHAMALRPSSVPLHVPLPPPPESSLLAVPDPTSDLARDASPTVSRLLATKVTDPSFESPAASALVAELDRHEDFECLAAAVPRFASMLPAPEGDPDAPDIPTPRSYVEAITGPYYSQWPTAIDAEMASWKSTGTYVNTVPPFGANIVDGMRIFRRDYELHSLDFSTAFFQGSLHEEIWLRRPPGFSGTTHAALGFTPSTADPSLFLRTDTSLPPFYVLIYIDDLVFATVDIESLTLVKLELQKRHTCTDLGPSALGFQFSSPQPTPLSTGHSLSAPPSDETVEPSGPYPELVGCLMHRKGYTISLGSGSVSWRSTHSSSVLSSSCEAEIHARAMAAQELRWLTYMLSDLGEQPCSTPVPYVDNKAMIALCQEHRVEHRTKHIALRYFLAQELQQHGQLRLAYVSTRANTPDIFTKALQPCDH